MRRALVSAALCGSVLAASIASCGEDEATDPTSAASASGAGGAGGVGGELVLVTATTGGPPDAELCGNEVHDVEFDAPALYFVLDASGSMLEAEGAGSRYDALRKAVVDLVHRLGDRARIGAALFPEGATDAQPCRPGDEVFPVAPGDSASDSGEKGPTTLAFAAAIDVVPTGGTPTAVTLEAVKRALVSVPGDRAVILVTDGGPNCNALTSCGPQSCIINMEDGCPSEIENCCDPFVGGTVQNCLDRARTLESVAALREAGVPVHVIGIAGSGPFSATLGQMAILGGAPTPEPPYFYEADDVSSLEAALASIALVVGSCVFELDEPPPETWRTNVWLDADRLPYDPADGWMWRGAPLDYVPVEPPPATSSTGGSTSSGGAAGGGGAAGSGGAAGGDGTGGSNAGGSNVGGEGGGPEVDTSAVELRGGACRRFKSGEVRRVQIVTGCPTTTPN